MPRKKRKRGRRIRVKGYTRKARKGSSKRIRVKGYTRKR